MGLLFPRKCVLCRTLLEKHETDLCHNCRIHAPVYTKSNFKLSFLAGWTAVWYYKDEARQSLLRYKFRNTRSYAAVYGRLLAMRLLTEQWGEFDVMTWVSTGWLRKFKRGYDHVALIAQTVSAEFSMPLTKLLRKVRNTPPQSGISDPARRRANVLGAYQVIDPELVKGKRILLLDDIITTGATISECARVLLTAGAKEVYCAAVAITSHDTK